MRTGRAAGRSTPGARVDRVFIERLGGPGTPSGERTNREGT